MATNRAKFLSVFLSLALAVSMFPLSRAEAKDCTFESANDSFTSSVETSIPTDSQLKDASPDQLIVTYKDDPVRLGDSIDVAAVGDGSLADVAKSAPSTETTLSEMGAVESDEVIQKDPACERGASSLLTFEEGVDLREVAAQLLSSPDVESVQPNFKYELSSVGSTSYHDATSTSPAKHATNDPFSFVSASRPRNQNYIYTTKVADAWANGYRANGNVTVAVIDSGPRLDHPDLSSAWALDYARDFTTSSYGNGVPYVDSPNDWVGKTGYECHSTWVSGILAATANNGMGIAGSSYNARVLPLKVTNGKTLYTSTIVRAYAYLDTLIESKRIPSLKVINLSLGGRQSDTRLKDAITHMSKVHNILTVSSAGNYGDDDHVYPADYSNVLSVMSVDDEYSRAWFSNYGGKNVSAPGVSITTTIPYSSTWSTSAEGKYSKDDINGTSFSAPLVSGIAAMCYSVKPTATAEEVRYSIISGATSLKNYDSTCAPFVNALQAIKNLKSGKGLYEATHTSISSAKVSSVTRKIYAGKRFKPTPKVKLNGKTLKKGKDYTLSYSNNKYPGKATITIKAKGAYKGSKKVSFTIIPKTPKSLKAKSGYRSLLLKWKKQTVGASGYQIRYSTSSKRYSSKKLKRGKTITVSGKNKISRRLTKLRSKRSYYVQIRSYKISGGKKYYSIWSSPKKARTL